jgi:hypothetical protein
MTTVHSKVSLHKIHFNYRHSLIKMRLEKAKDNGTISNFFGHVKIQNILYRVSHELRSLLRESVPYVKIYRYNPEHLCPKSNGYGDNGHRKVWSSGGSTHCTCQLTSLIDVCPWARCPFTEIQLTLALYQNVKSVMLRQYLPYMCHV